LMWIKKIKSDYAVELWDLALTPVLRLRENLSQPAGLSLLFAE
jgi:hypothetical protein